MNIYIKNFEVKTLKSKMSCCKRITNQFKEIALKYYKIKELKKFCLILLELNENNKEIIFYKLCNERIAIYNNNNISLKKIQKYIEFCDSIIKLLQ